MFIFCVSCTVKANKQNKYRKEKVKTKKLASFITSFALSTVVAQVSIADALVIVSNAPHGN